MADRQELCYLTIPEAARLLESKQLSPVELTQAFLDRIEAVDGGLHSYVTLLPESALEEARAAESGHPGGRVPRPAPRHPHRPEGPVRHGGASARRRSRRCWSTGCLRGTRRW